MYISKIFRCNLAASEYSLFLVKRLEVIIIHVMLQVVKEIPVNDKMEPDQVMKVSVMKEVIKPTKPHRHAGYHELIILKQGAGFHEIDGEEFEVISPIAYYLRPGQTHCWNFSSIPKGFVILFKEELLFKQDIAALFDLPSQVALPIDNRLFNLSTIFFEEFKYQQLNEDASRAYIHLLVAKLKGYVSTGKPNLNSQSYLVQEFKRLINNYCLTQKQLIFYAKQLNITVAVLNAACKKTLNKTPATLINERVLLEAKLLLSATVKSIGEIAAYLGFTDTSHFIKFFKQNTTLTPGLYREMAATKR
jgi:AraC family transcriptional activator of pobA